MMSFLVQAIDSLMEAFHAGENGHTEHDWSTVLQEQLIQFDFQCVRTDPAGVENLGTILDDLLSKLAVRTNFGDIDLLVLLYKMIGKTRDIEGGKGEYALSYMMIWKWYAYFPELAEIAISLFVHQIDQKPYGSWKDIKYFCQYIVDRGSSVNHPLILKCIDLVNKQLRNDFELYSFSKETAKLSLVSKWIPREKSKFGWMTKNLAYSFYPEYMITAENNVAVSLENRRVLVERCKKAEKKCITKYRILCSTLNKHIDTVQIKQAGKMWAEIDHSKTTSITIAKNKKAFLNIRNSQDPDRILCAENFKRFIEMRKKSGKEIKGKHVGLDMFTRSAIEMIHSDENSEEVYVINSQWRDNVAKKNADGLGPVIAIVDTSGSMSGDPLHAAIALGCRVAEKSIFGKRVMTFSRDPEWINLDDCDTFTKMVSKIVRTSNAGMSTDFYKALDLILTAIETMRVPQEDAENVILAVFSDMQIDDNLSDMTGVCTYNPSEEQKVVASKKWDTMYDKIREKYREVGMRMYGKPMNPPHILFWNLRKTNGFPVLSSERNCSMISGYDPAVLNLFCEVGIDALKEMTPFNVLVKQLDNERYLPLETAIRAHLHC